MDWLTRDLVYDLILEADEAGEDRKTYVRQKLIEQHPILESLTVVRNGRVFAALDYLAEDLDTYGAVPSE